MFLSDFTVGTDELSSNRLATTEWKLECESTVISFILDAFSVLFKRVIIYRTIHRKVSSMSKKVKAVYSASWETHLRATGRRASLAIWDHTVLPATRHKWTRPVLTLARQAGTRFSYPGGMEGWVDLGSWTAARPGIEPTTAWSQVRRPNRYATKPLQTITWLDTARRCNKSDDLVLSRQRWKQHWF